MSEHVLAVPVLLGTLELVTACSTSEVERDRGSELLERDDRFFSLPEEDSAGTTVVSYR